MLSCKISNVFHVLPLPCQKKLILRALRFCNLMHAIMKSVKVMNGSRIQAGVCPCCIDTCSCCRLFNLHCLLNRIIQRLARFVRFSPQMLNRPSAISFGTAELSPVAGASLCVICPGGTYSLLGNSMISALTPENVQSYNTLVRRPTCTIKWSNHTFDFNAHALIYHK